MSRQYADCYYCGGEVIEQLIEREYRWKGRLYLIENVPAGVCRQCGEKYLKSTVAKKIEAMVLSEQQPARKILVPVYTFA